MNNVSLQANPAPLGVGAVLNGVAYYCDTIEGFLKTSAEDVLSRLLRAIYIVLHLSKNVDQSAIVASWL